MKSPWRAAWWLTASVAILAAARADAAVIRDQAFIPERDPVEGYDGNQLFEFPRAQTFTVGVAGKLQGVSLLISQLDPDGELVVEILPTVDGKPTDAREPVLAAGRLTLSEVPSSSPGGTGPGWVYVDLSLDALLVEEGQMLALSVRGDRGSEPGGDIAWFGGLNDAPDVYADGDTWMWLEDLVWICLWGPDPCVYQPPPPDGWYPASSINDYGFQVFIDVGDNIIPEPGLAAVLICGLLAFMTRRRPRASQTT